MDPWSSPWASAPATASLALDDGVRTGVAADIPLGDDPWALGGAGGAGAGWGGGLDAAGGGVSGGREDDGAPYIRGAAAPGAVGVGETDADTGAGGGGVSATADERSLSTSPAVPRSPPTSTPLGVSLPAAPAAPATLSAPVALDENVWGDDPLAPPRGPAEAFGLYRGGEARGDAALGEAARGEAAGERSGSNSPTFETAAAGGVDGSDTHGAPNLPPARTEAADDHPSEQQRAATASTLSRLGGAVASWRRSRAAAAADARNAKAAEEAQGWRKVGAPKPAGVSFSQWFRRKESGTGDQENMNGVSACATASDALARDVRTAAPTPPAPASASAAVLSASDLSWLDASSSASRQAATADRAAAVGTGNGGAVGTSDVCFEPPDLHAAPTLHAARHALRPGPFVQGGAGERYESIGAGTGGALDGEGRETRGPERTAPRYSDEPGARYVDEPGAAAARPPQKHVPLRPPPPPASARGGKAIDLLSTSPPEGRGTLTHADLDFFENL
ncbi:hypothetical protein MSPP1_000945 [Malassezia sp. CBS 17886]|nr:hypothetical protein MSPP1_000945 [Malassezia sp. CBS 17886]